MFPSHDIGGSTGIFADKISKILGCKAVVVDPNKDEIAEAAKKGLTCCCKQFKDYKSGTQYDLISMLRTVEHLSQISIALQKVKEMLSKKGVFFLDIVNHLWLMKMFKSSQLSTKIDHIYQLTDETISRYLLRFFPEMEIVKSDIEFRYIFYLVKPKC